MVQFIRAKWYIYTSGILFIAVANIVQAYYPRILGEFTDQLELGGLTKSMIVNYSLLLMGVGITFAILAGIGQFHIMYVGRIFEFFTRKRLFDHFTTLSESFYSKNGVGKLLSYVMNDVTAVRESISMGVNQSANAAMLLLSAVFFMLLSSIPLYLIIACVLPMLAIPWIVVRIGPVIRERSMAVQQSLARMTESAEEQFGGIRVTKKFAVEPIMNERFGRTVDTLRDNQLQLVRISSLFQALIPFLGALSLMVTIGLGGYLTIQDHISLGEFVALTLYIRMMVNPLQQIGNVINTMQRSRASLERLNDLLSKRSEIQEVESARALDLHNTSIRIKQLTFTYPDATQEALHDIDLEIEPGTIVGIIGRTGSGKTTLMKLLLRIYEPPNGTVWVGETDIRDMTLESLREQIAYVPQEGFLFSTSIRDNIAFYQRDTSFEFVEKAAKQAQIYNNITAFPEQFDTKLGERGVTLSGGQRQRTSLARGIIKNAPIMILDDSVSAVDSVTENHIIAALRSERKNKTTIIIAHRISALKYADLIIVLDKGRIVQQGVHKELLAQKGIYAMLHSIQEEGNPHVEGY
ncbi:MAG: ABC transporter ATP-binding protein [Paenibacillaceae bacterium]